LNGIGSHSVEFKQKLAQIFYMESLVNLLDRTDEEKRETDRWARAVGVHCIHFEADFLHKAAVCDGRQLDHGVQWNFQVWQLI
jgi:hypothetical protein